jgi:hypothetical protein
MTVSVFSCKVIPVNLDCAKIAQERPKSGIPLGFFQSVKTRTAI